MPRDNDNDNASSRGRRDGPSGGKGRSGARRGPDKKFAKRGFGAKDFGGKRDGERRPSAEKSDGARSYGKKPYSGAGKSYGDREGRPPRRDGDAPRPRSDRPFSDRPSRFNRDDRPSRGEGGERRSFTPREDRGGDKRPYTPRGERGEGRSAARFSDKKFGDRKSDASGDRGERYRDRGDAKPWRKREGSPREDRGGERPRFSRSRDDRAGGDRPKFGKPRFDKPRERRGDGEDRPRFSRGGDERSSGERPFRDRSEGRRDWQEHPRSDRRPDRFTDRPRRDNADRPRRDNEDDSKVFAKRPAFGGRGAYRDRKPDFDKRAARDEARPQPKKSGERIAKVLARAGLASRRDAEEMVVQGRVTVNGRVINSPALDVTANDVVAVDGAPLPARERTRLFLYHKPRGLMTTHADPEGRPTVFDNLPEGLPRLISVGRLDFNTEGLLLLTNDGGLARELELP